MKSVPIKTVTQKQKDAIRKDQVRPPKKHLGKNKNFATSNTETFTK